MKTIYLVYSSDYDAYEPYKCFVNKCDAEEFVTKLEKIHNVVENAASYHYKFIKEPFPPNRPELKMNSYDWVKDSAIGGDLHRLAQEDHKNDLIKYEKELVEYRKEYEIYNEKWNELYNSFIKDNLTEEEYKLYELYRNPNDHIGIKEIDYEENND